MISLIKSELLYYLRKQHDEIVGISGIDGEWASEFLEDYEEELYDFVSKNISKKSILPEDVAQYAESNLRERSMNPSPVDLENLFDNLTIELVTSL